MGILSEAGRLALRTSQEVISAVASGAMSASSYVETLTTRFRTLDNGRLNAMIYWDEVGALAAAADIDASIVNHKEKPLFGLPLVVKDNINTKALKTTAGTPALRNCQPRFNAPSLQKLIDAGALVLGKSNLHELAMGVTNTNFTLGVDSITGMATHPARNPYDLTRIPGGSSGGTAIAIAAGFATCGLGTDTAGSGRIPAALCGIVGLRPSFGRYEDTLTDFVPIIRGRDTIAPMGRTVADVALLDAIMSDSPFYPLTALPLQGIRMGVPASFWTGLDNELKSVADAAMAKLTEAGVVMVDEDIEGVMELNSKCSFPIIWHDSIEFLETYLQVCSPGTTVRDVADQVASPDVKHLIFEVLQDSFDPILYEEAKNLHLPALRALYEQYIKRNKLDAIIFPTTIIQAPSIDLINGSSVLKDNLLIRNTDPGSNACIPGLSIPVGLTPDGLPVGLAIDGPVGSDPTLLRIGLSMEMLLGSLPFPSLLEDYT